MHDASMSGSSLDALKDYRKQSPKQDIGETITWTRSSRRHNSLGRASHTQVGAGNAILEQGDLFRGNASPTRTPSLMSP